VPAEEVLVLPNSSNVVMAAERAAELSEKPARVVTSSSQQAGLLALVELDSERGAAENAERLGAALGGIRTGAVAPAARDDAQGRFRRGDAVGLVGEEVVAWGGAGSTLAATIERLGAEAELVTVIGGREAPIPLAELGAHAPAGIELEVQEGGQPHYWWLLASQ
jgi:dihydroxyacetone kinase-like predicted kinase